MNKSYPGNYYMDVGNAGYEQACMAHATAMAKAAGFDGLFLDDVTAIPHVEIAAGVTMAQYPTPGAWDNAMSSMVTAAATQSHAQGLLVVGNIGGAWTAPGVWQTWSSQLDGAEEESWGGLGSAGQQLSTWHAKLAEAQWSAAHGKIALLHSFDTSETGNTFDMASMLLTADGKIVLLDLERQSDQRRGLVPRVRHRPAPRRAGRILQAARQRRLRAGLCPRHRPGQRHGQADRTLLARRQLQRLGPDERQLDPDGRQERPDPARQLILA